MAKMGSRKHLKRYKAPKSWPIHPKEDTWTVKPSAGSHSIEDAIPLTLVIRDVLKLADNSREAKRIINSGNILVDGKMVVCEVKKSSRAERSARLQLAHYLYDLRKAGIEARGVLMFPTEKKRVEVVLTDELMAELDTAYDAIGTLVRRDAPPAAESCKYCDK